MSASKAVSKAEHYERVEWVRRLCVRCVPEQDIVKAAMSQFNIALSTAKKYVREVRDAYRAAAQRQLSPIEIGSYRAEQIEMVREVISKAWQEIAMQEHKSAQLLDAERTLERLAGRFEGTDIHIEGVAGDVRKLRKFMAAWEPNHRGRVAQMNVILSAIKLLSDLTGTVVQKVELSGPGGGPIEVLERMSDSELDTFLADQGVHLTLLQGGKAS